MQYTEENWNQTYTLRQIIDALNSLKRRECVTEYSGYQSYTCMEDDVNGDYLHCDDIAHALNITNNSFGNPNQFSPKVLPCTKSSISVAE